MTRRELSCEKKISCVILRGSETYKSVAKIRLVKTEGTSVYNRKLESVHTSDSAVLSAVPCGVYQMSINRIQPIQNSQCIANVKVVPVLN
jgi:hypothetical protein